MNTHLVLERKTDSVAHRRHADRDQDLVDALRRRESIAPEWLVARYGDRAYRLASATTGNGHDAEEVVQDAFWTVVRKIDTFRGDSAFGSWFYRIVANTAYQKIRTRRSRKDDVSLDAVLPVFDERHQHADHVADWSLRADDPAIQTELRTALTEAIDELPDGYRLVLVLHDVEGRSHGEIAEALGLNVAAVKVRAHRARLFLRNRLGEWMSDVAATAAAAVA